MQNVILIVHLILALSLIGVVLLQRSEGGGLGMGGGGGAMSQRAAATAMGKVTWILAAAFIVTSLTLTILAAQDASGVSVMDRLTGGTPSDSPASDNGTLDTDALLPPPAAEDTGADANAPLVPRAD
ncbi:preprotein translocase subunit SecG [Salipiger aestuarii]|uniref:Protein-export membrane protein SecG n=1 Tax=Salipiger aestuarii TaxID=568098 RepID=A0A327Y574_9RHOB|nr:preprotein translocase subunit SecG [Salipiger aestuarii]EIE51994.1 preprotein translocase subunit SecG [Citreicella sp. 357]KAA8606347.1 preprotein translocase subunit SecG [Salipiger aestuarii]KAA8610635.1 preprotein translocase subunit SecG [Salipiger aestuarii]KAB2541635.1 preprotein translocase subunit SecG [Salipiger aestuarii]RAK14895.1 preprotein translocase subunit SecG [Salipiger aestuarii]